MSSFSCTYTFTYTFKGVQVTFYHASCMQLPLEEQKQYERKNVGTFINRENYENADATCENARSGFCKVLFIIVNGANYLLTSKIYLFTVEISLSVQRSTKASPGELDASR